MKGVNTEGKQKPNITIAQQCKQQSCVCYVHHAMCVLCLLYALWLVCICVCHVCVSTACSLTVDLNLKIMIKWLVSSAPVVVEHQATLRRQVLYKWVSRLLSPGN